MCYLEKFFAVTYETVQKGAVMKKKTFANRMIEFSFVAQDTIKSPDEVDFSATFTSPSGKTYKVPGFWDGRNIWKIRYASDEKGIHTFQTDCIPLVKGLAGQKGLCQVVKTKNEKNPLYRFGFPRIIDGNIVYASGRKFFWLGDTWYMGLCKRLDRKGFKILSQDRKKKGFTVIQIVAGLYPDMEWYDPRGEGEGGFPYSKDFSKTNAAYFRDADWKIKYLVENGLVPCIFGAWGYYIKWTGVEKMKKHWRNLIARWSAYPVIWCIAGETTMPYYLSTTRQQDTDFQKKAWTLVAQYIRNIDPFKHPVTTHSPRFGHQMLEDVDLIDINMLQPGHSGPISCELTWTTIEQAKKELPAKPVVVGEVNYEGIGECCRQEIQRIVFWASFLSGAKGFTYGANGIWQVNTEKKPYGPSPHGRSWGDTPWRQAYKLPGSQHVAAGKRILEKFDWRNLIPCREKVEFKDEKQYLFAAEVPDKVLLIYAGPPAFCSWIARIKGLRPESFYKLCLIDPKDGKKAKGQKIKTDREGNWSFEKPFWAWVPVWQDWLICIERIK